MTPALRLDLLSLARRYAAELSELPGQGTDLHDHGGSAGAFTVVSGEITEEIVGLDGSLTRGNYADGDGHSFGPHHVHRIVNISGRPAVTIHAYGPALRTMTRYRLAGNELVAEDISAAGADW